MAAAVAGDRGSRRIVRLTVPEQLGAILRELREQHVGFEGAWVTARGRIVWPESQRETEECEKALAATKGSWRACYEGWTPEPRERAVVGLLEALAARSAA